MNGVLVLRISFRMNGSPLYERWKEKKGFGYLSILLLDEDAPARAFSRVSQSVSCSLIPQGPLDAKIAKLEFGQCRKFKSDRL